MTKIRLVETKYMDGCFEAERYLSPCGQRIQREDHGFTPNGNPFAGRWVLRDRAGTYVDHDQYRHDLMERNGFSDVPITIEQFLVKEFA